MKTVNDLFTTKLFDYGNLQLIVNVDHNNGTLQLRDGGAYSLPLVATLNKDAAFLIYNNSSIHTYAEMRTQLLSLRAR